MEHGLAFMVMIAAGAVAEISAPSAPPTLAGFWYGIGEPGDPEVFYIDAFHPDGRFNAECRKCEKGKLVYQQTQAGMWKIVDGVLTINSTEIDASRAGSMTPTISSFDSDRVSSPAARPRFPVRRAARAEVRVPAVLLGV